MAYHNPKTPYFRNLPKGFHLELSQGARKLYSRLLVLSKSGTQQCFYENKQAKIELGTEERTTANHFKALKDAGLITTQRGRTAKGVNRRIITVIVEKMPTALDYKNTSNIISPPNTSTKAKQSTGQKPKAKSKSTAPKQPIKPPQSREYYRALDSMSLFDEVLDCMKFNKHQSKKVKQQRFDALKEHYPDLFLVACQKIYPDLSQEFEILPQDIKHAAWDLVGITGRESLEERTAKENALSWMQCLLYEEYQYLKSSCVIGMHPESYSDDIARATYNLDPEKMDRPIG